jgi:hypothetical protein
MSDNMSYTFHFGADSDETRNEYKMEFCDETLRKYIGTRNSNLVFATRKRIALQFLYGLTTFTAKASCIAEDVGRVSGHAEHQRGVGDENFLGVNALAAAVGEGDVERGGRRGLVHLRSLSENPTGNHPGHAGFRSAERTALFPNGPYLPYVGPRPTRPTKPTKPTKPIQEDGWMGHPCRK